MTSTASEFIFSHLVASLMCCYSLACVVLTKIMLPFQYRTGFSAALGVVEQHGTGELFWIKTLTANALFSLTALLSTLILAVLFGIMRANAHRYASTLIPRTSVSASAAKRVPLREASSSTGSLVEP